jgi:hypothetical protein
MAGILLPAGVVGLGAGVELAQGALPFRSKPTIVPVNPAPAGIGEESDFLLIGAGNVAVVVAAWEWGTV